LPPLPGIKLRNIHTLRTIRDADAIRELTEKGHVREAVVVGAGFIGLEAAENLAHKGIRVTVLEVAPLILPGYDEEMSAYIKKYLMEKGLTVENGVKIQGFEDDGAGNVQGVILEDRTIPAQCVVWAGGVRPNVCLAAEAGCAIGRSGAIVVNEYQQTNIPNIYAVGDCTENLHGLTGEKVWLPMGSTANKTGRIAGLNIGKEVPQDLHTGVLGTSIIKLFGLHAARTGLTEKQARDKGYDVESVIVKADDKAHYYPGYRLIITKLIADQKTKRVLGAQIVGEGVVDKPVDIIATLISCQGTLEQLSRLDLAYAPPFSTAISSSALAANVLLNKIQGKFRGINAGELVRMMEKEEAVIVDVRTEEEYFCNSIPGSLNIPEYQLAERAREIPAGKRAVIVCRGGRRAYLALPVFRKLGFHDAVVLEGGIEAYPYELE
jgi:NADPH-dependent 2,4-dienoyl-CoA reductase/sulfur reductase-like enzyme/rhodanese-related sulfurtransferase